MQCPGFSRISFLMVVLTGLAVPSLSQNTARPLTNADIEKMVKAGLPESVIVREVQVSEPNFDASPDGLINLKHHHVPDGVLGAIVDSQNSPRMLQAAPPGVLYSAGPSSPTAQHRLPNVDAAFRIDSRTTGKIQVRANQIKVEKAGIPLFIVKWKLNPVK
jgi:hypothetical protein